MQNIINKQSTMGHRDTIFLLFCLFCAIVKGEDALNCSENIFENLLVSRVLHGKTLPTSRVNVSDLSDETVLEVVAGQIPILCYGDLNLEDLVYLKLSNVKLQELQEDVFSALPNLREVNMKKNRLTEIKNGIFNGTDLVVVNLEGNRITHIEENAFDDMPYLMSVDFDLNRIQELNVNWFSNTPNLRYISFNFNQIKKIPANAFKYMFEFDGLNIYLVNNEIEEIEPNAFGNFRNFGNFVLDHNMIETLPMNLLPNTNHTFGLSLYGNRISCIEDRLLHNLASSCRKLDLRKNPFNPNCLEEVKLYAEEYKTFLDLESPDIRLIY